MEERGNSVVTRDVRGDFLPGVAEQLGFYVYLLIDPRDDQPFYVGKGTGGRCFAHLRESQTTTADSQGDYPKLRTIRAITADGLQVRIHLLRHGLDEPTAYTVEGAALDLLTMEAVDARVTGHGNHEVGRMSIEDANARYGATPVAIEEKGVLLIRISRLFRAGMSDEELYEVTRGWWKASRTSTQRVKWVFAVNGGVVRAVYRVDGWEPSTDGKRLGFSGQRDADMESRYLARDVTAYSAPAAQNPLRYVNC